MSAKPEIVSVELLVCGVRAFLDMVDALAAQRNAMAVLAAAILEARGNVPNAPNFPAGLESQLVEAVALGDPEGDDDDDDDVEIGGAGGGGADAQRKRPRIE